MTWPITPAYPRRRSKDWRLPRGTSVVGPKRERPSWLRFKKPASSLSRRMVAELASGLRNGRADPSEARWSRRSKQLHRRPFCRWLQMTPVRPGAVGPDEREAGWRSRSCPRSYGVVKAVRETLRHKSSKRSCRSISVVAGSGSRCF
jgi:hypothetical protein